MESLIDHNQILKEARCLLALLAETTQDITRRDLSILETPTESRAEISIAEKTVVSVVATICSLSVDREHFDHKQPLRNDNKMEIPITIERKTQYTIENVSLLCYETASVTLSGEKNDIVAIMGMLEKNGYTPERFNTTGIKLLTTHLNPQKIRYDTKRDRLTIDGTIIDFDRANEQSRLLRIMFGGRGRSRSKVEFEQIYEFWAKEEYEPLSWDAYGKLDDGDKRAKFIKDVRNTVVNINNKVRKAISMTEDFLKVTNSTCRINPKLLKL